MQKARNLSVVCLVLSIFLPILVHVATGQVQEENMQTFFESQWPGIAIQINTTREASPGENITLILLVKGKSDDICIENLDLKVFGFAEGQNKTLLGNIHQDAFPLDFNQTRKCNYTLTIPLEVWDPTYGELSLKYSIQGFSYNLSSLGFTMTHVKNVYLEKLEKEIQSLSENLTELQQDYAQLEGNYTELKGKYDETSKSTVGPDNTRYVVIVLAITTVVFVATTIYFIVWKPRQY